MANTAKTILGPANTGLVIDTLLEQRGSQPHEFVSFRVFLLGPLLDVTVDWTDNGDAVAMAKAIICGTVPDEIAVEWLRETNDEVADLMSQGMSSDYVFDGDRVFVYIWTASMSVGQATRRLNAVFGKKFSKNRVRSKAWWYRERGVGLKMMSCSGVTADRI